MIKLIVGLGNPGRQYQKTRHNAGFLFLDQVAEKYGGEFAIENRFDGMLATCSVASQKLLMLKPQTFMNRSGQSVGKIARYFKLKPESILVAHDELDFDAGTAKLKMDGGHAGHNGLRDIIAHLGSNQFYRLRLGIGRPSDHSPVANYVLSEPSVADSQHIHESMVFCLNWIDSMVAGDMTKVMNQLNAMEKKK